MHLYKHMTTPLLQPPSLPFPHTTMSNLFISLLFISHAFLALVSATSYQSEQLIRALNLTPKDATADSGGPEYNHNSRLVERTFRLPGLSLDGPSVNDLGHHAGYFRLPNTHAARLFYFFFESRSGKKDDPVVIWLTGGPGCSSELALFYENGPYKITDNLTLEWNDFGWDKASNIIYVDQPTGTGFSYSSDEDDIRHNETGVSDDLYNFLQVFFKKHPKYAKNDFYITGESYAGHYIPALASRIYKGNKAKEGLHINLKGCAIGNGLTDPEIQYKAYADYALQMGIIDKTIHDDVDSLYPRCRAEIKQCGNNGTTSCEEAFSTCNTIFSAIRNVIGDANYYDIRKKCIGSLCYDFSNMESFLNKQSVRDALGVGKIDFVSCSPEVYEAMIQDWMRNLEVGIPTLLDNGIRFLIYAGEYDLICNWLGNSRWVEAMKWSGQDDFVSSPEKSFIVDGKEAGTVKGVGPLFFLKVHNAGHMVPMDQPKAALEMLSRWINIKDHL